MPSWGSYSYAWGPLVAVLVVTVLVVVLRWAFSSRKQSLVRPVTGRPGRPGDYGLLVDVAAARSAVEAEAFRIALLGAGVHATVAGTTSGLRVLVWPPDEEHARSVVDRVRRGA